MTTGTESVFCGNCMQVQPCRVERTGLDYVTWVCTVCDAVADSEIIDLDD
jgi:hypothetical protein